VVEERWDEFQWLSLALVGDTVTRRASGLKISASITPHRTHFHSTPLPLLLSLLLILLSEKDMVGGMALNIRHFMTNLLYRCLINIFIFFIIIIIIIIIIINRM